MGIPKEILKIQMSKVPIRKGAFFFVLIVREKDFSLNIYSPYSKLEVMDFWRIRK